MVTQSPYKLEHVTKPGHGEPVPVRTDDFSPRDTPENVRRCLSCTFPACRNGACIYVGEPQKRKAKKAVQDTSAVDLAIWEKIRIGGTDSWICAELGISRDELAAAKKRLKKSGVMR